MLLTYFAHNTDEAYESLDKLFFFGNLRGDHGLLFVNYTDIWSMFLKTFLYHGQKKKVIYLYHI
jgi:hypothetical protein